jgi:hypothetical protein
LRCLSFSRIGAIINALHKLANYCPRGVKCLLRGLRAALVR